MSSPDALSVVLDATALDGASGFRGIGTYVRNLLSGLVEAGVAVTALSGDPSQLPPGVTPHRVRRVAPGRWQAQEHRLLLPGDVRRARRRSGARLFHSPGILPPRTTSGPTVLTVHDLAPLDAAVTSPERLAWEAAVPAFRAMDGVVAISRHTADDAVARLGLAPARVTVAPLGVSPTFSPGPGEAGPDYVLFVGEYDPRKRHDLAIAAVDLLLDRGVDVRLRMVGRVAPWFAEAWRDLVAASRHPERIEVLGHVSLERLVELYRGARVVLVTSAKEGFGLPALEAMATGAPVVAFDNSATSEVVGGAGVLVADGDVVAFADAVEELLRDPALRDATSARCRERSATFTWARCVERHLEAYTSALAVRT